jgi:hypothetical protein
MHVNIDDDILVLQCPIARMAIEQDMNRTCGHGHKLVPAGRNTSSSFEDEMPTCAYTDEEESKQNAPLIRVLCVASCTNET